MKARRFRLERRGWAYAVAWLAAVAMALASAGCAGDEHSPVDDFSWIDWDNPIGGKHVQSTAEAQEAVLFSLRVPRSLGVPTGIIVTDFPAAPESVVAFMYDHPEYGAIVVQEHLPDVEVNGYVAGLDELEQMSHRPGTQGTATRVSVRDGDPGLLTTTQDGSRSELWWLDQSEVEIIVRGPALTAEACLAVAELV